MENTDPASLDRLNDFVLPEPVGLIPLAPVWKFVIAMAMVWLATWIWLRIARYIGNAYRRDAIGELDAITADGDLVKLNELLKRTAMMAYGRDAVASLYGDRWLTFLKSVSRSNIDIAVLGDCSSKMSTPVSSEEIDQIFKFARDWIHHHQTETPASMAPVC